MSEWKEVRLGDICEILDSKRVPLSAIQRKQRQGPYPYYGAQNIIDHVDDYLLDGEYLLVAEDGANLVTRTQNIANLVSGKFWVNNHAHILGYNGKCPLNLLGFILNKSNISTYVTGCAQPKLNQDNLRRISINLPKKVDEIASILSSFDDKIAINRKICANLEAQAQALFKHWFIDFAPFKDGKFVESELGMIPEGWKVGTAEDFYTINIGKTPPRAEQQWFSYSKEANKVWISISDMGNCGTFISDSKEYLTSEAQNKFNVLMVPSGTVLLSFKLTIGRVAIADTDLTTNEAIARFILPNIEYREFTYLYLKQYKYGSLGSTSSIATAVNSKIIKTMPFLMPSKDIVSKFSNITHQIFDGIRILNQESSHLSSLRDTLLPKLMSGEIKV